MTICSFRRGISGFWQVVPTFVPGRCTVVATTAVTVSATVALGNCQSCIRGQQHQCSNSENHLENHHLVNPIFKTPKWKLDWKNHLGILVTIMVEINECRTRWACKKKQIELGYPYLISEYMWRLKEYLVTVRKISRITAKMPIGPRTLLTASVNVGFIHFRALHAARVQVFTSPSRWRWLSPTH